ncbi:MULTISPECIES: hypothetical protein [Salinibacter]|jgi:hypothetical protein|uniref:hypothetical protein n=1 Tax=Salinibacter TaxID=146918 RepID=UPI001ABAC707|nr:MULTISPECIES: hypothetical protein [Salinibacter]
MKVLVEYFGMFIFAFVVFVGGLVALPEIGAPETSLGEMGGLALAFIVIAGGFSWFYSAELPSETQRRPGRRSRSDEPPR